MFIGELKRFHKTKSFVNWASHGKIVDCYLTQNSLAIDDKQSSVSAIATFTTHRHSDSIGIVAGIQLCYR